MVHKRFQGHEKIFPGVGRVTVYYAELVRFLGANRAATILLCQLAFWKDLGDSPDGWIYKTRDEWTYETTLSRWEQEQSRNLLKKRGYLLEERRGMTRKVYYKLEMPKLERDWTQWCINRAVDRKESGRLKVSSRPPWMVSGSPPTEKTPNNTEEIKALNKSLVEKYKMPS